jgi:hypothetical protein
MNSDNFEKHLQRQLRRELPPEWRSEILAAAQSASTTRATPSAHRSLLSTFILQLSNFCQPSPKAWAGLAAVWVVILALNFAARDSAPQRVARQSVPPSAEVRRLLKQQEQLFVELVGPVEKSDADRPKPVGLQPRSQRCDGLFTA